MAYTVSAQLVVHFSRGFDDATWPVAWSAWSSGKKYIACVERKTPPTLRLADELVHDGCPGLLFPSLRAQDGVNLVLFLANLTEGDQVEVVDPKGRLPRN